MPSTPGLALPYPSAGDPNDVPADLQALAEEVEAKVVPLAGGTLSGALNLADQQLLRALLRDPAEKVEAIATTTGAIALDYELGPIFTIPSLTGNITLTVTNWPASGRGAALSVRIIQGGTLRSVTWPANTKWAGGVTPTMAINTTNWFTLTTVDAGARIDAFVGGLAQA